MPVVLGTDSYVSEAELTAYATANGLAEPADPTAGLKTATINLDRKYGGRYIGSIYSSTQPLLWPRAVSYDRYGKALASIPTAIKDAVCELACSTADFYVAPTPAVTEESVTVDVITQSRKFAGTWSAPTAFDSKLEMILAPVINPVGENPTRITR